jgi:hypothetical protein
VAFHATLADPAGACAVGWTLTLAVDLHAQRVRPQAGEAPVAQVLDDLPGQADRAGGRVVQAGGEVSSVVLPEPDGPATATISPVRTVGSIPRSDSIGGVPG